MEKSTISVDLGKIRPNPYQPETRAKVPEELAERFGKSILEHGLLQIPLARQVDGPGIYEMGDGWIRLKGFEWLVKNGHVDYQNIPIDVREITNQQMADLVMEANTVRKDLTPIEEAHLFKRYIEDFGVSETQLAKKHNLTQGAVSNTIRLLQLPEDIQQKVTNNELSGTHARQLLRLNVHPDMQAKMAKDSIERGLSVSALDNQIQQNLWYMSESLKPDDGYRSPSFDIKECESCEFRMKIALPYAERKSEWRCTKKECWDRKNDAALKVLAQEAKAKMKEKGIKFLTDNDIGYDQRERLDKDNLSRLDNPQECKTCERRAYFKYRNDTAAPSLICIDKACFRKKQTKKTKKTKDTNKVKKVQDQQLTTQLGETFKGLTDTKSCLQVLARHTLPRLSADGKLDLCSIFPDMPKLGNGRLNMDALLASLGKKSIEELMRLAIAATITTARRNQCYDQYSTELKDGLKRDYAILTGTLSKYEAEVRKFEEENCRGCRFADEEFIGTGEECCRNHGWARRIGKNGKCEGRKEEVKEPVA